MLVAGCGSSGAKVDARAELTRAKQVVDRTPSLHFHLTSSNVVGSGPLLTGGDGDAKRPDGFTGILHVTLNGFGADVDVVSVGGTLHAKLPFSGGYQVTDPKTYGFGDPAVLLDPNRGLSSLLPTAQQPSDAGLDRLNGEELQEITAALPGDRVAALLTSADPSRDVTARIGISTATHQVRRVILTGPFFDKQQQSTFTVVLDRYGENVTVTAPPS